MVGSGPRKVVLEVERKFAKLRVNPFHAKGGTPAFRSLINLGSKIFTDTYYDHQQTLSNAGTWLRKRDGRWQSKVRQAGDYNSSQFREIGDLKDIETHVQKILNRGCHSANDFGLASIATITTHRMSWKANDHFTIVLDRTSFNHTVGEVELEATVDVQSEADVTRYCSKMDDEISDFMQKYSWAFDTISPIGKLTAYFAQRSSQV